MLAKKKTDRRVYESSEHLTTAAGVGEGVKWTADAGETGGRKRGGMRSKDALGGTTRWAI